MYSFLRRHLPTRVANGVYVLIMSLLISCTLLLAAFPETSLRYARM